jgi:hypothetical protein
MRKRKLADGCWRSAAKRGGRANCFAHQRPVENLKVPYRIDHECSRRSAVLYWDPLEEVETKKLILCLTFLLFFTMSAFCQDDPDTGVVALLLASSANLYPGFGIGSFGIGDQDGGYTQLVSDFIGFACLTASTFLSDIYYGGPLWFDTSSERLRIAGLLLLIPAKVFGAIRPWVYAAGKRKRRTDKAQGASTSVSFGIAPSVTPSATRLGFDIGIEVTLGYALE